MDEILRAKRLREEILKRAASIKDHMSQAGACGPRLCCPHAARAQQHAHARTPAQVNARIANMAVMEEAQRKVGARPPAPA